VNGRNVTLAEIKRFYGAHHKTFNEDRSTLPVAKFRSMILVLGVVPVAQITHVAVNLSRYPQLFGREISFQDIYQRYRQTDGRQAIARSRFAL